MKDTLKNIAGMTFGRWLVLRPSESHAATNGVRWDCVCNCGTKRSVKGASLRTGVSTSCGCHRREQLLRANLKHGRCSTTEYHSWHQMRCRCNWPRGAEFKNYGARGITVCERWNEFENFLADMGPKPSPQHTIDRIDVNGGYTPENCRWATKSEQARNSRKTSIVTYGGIRMPLADAYDMKPRPVSYNAVRSRLNNGWALNKALETQHSWASHK